MRRRDLDLFKDVLIGVNRQGGATISSITHTMLNGNRRAARFCLQVLERGGFLKSERPKAKENPRRVRPLVFTLTPAGSQLLTLLSRLQAAREEVEASAF